MIVDPFSIHLDQYDDDMSEENQDSHLDYPVESSYGGSDVLRLSQEDPRRHSNCNICNLGFKNREQLDRHKQIHTAVSVLFLLFFSPYLHFSSSRHVLSSFLFHRVFSTYCYNCK